MIAGAIYVDDACSNDPYCNSGAAYTFGFAIEPQVSCGDGLVEGVEECDDGNPVDGDGCDTNCTNTACGNGIVTVGEECDDGNTIDFDGCTSDCMIPPIPAASTWGLLILGLLIVGIGSLMIRRNRTTNHNISS